MAKMVCTSVYCRMVYKFILSLHFVCMYDVLEIIPHVPAFFDVRMRVSEDVEVPNAYVCRCFYSIY